jgi:hypothetical protein
MNPNLFKGPDRVPETPNRVPTYQATTFRSLSSRDESFQSAVAHRTARAQRRFGFEGPPVDQGDRLVFRSDTQSLEIYRASDSLWWTDHELAHRDAVKGRISLPSEAVARRAASRELARLRLNMQGAAVGSVTFIEASISEPRKRPRTVRTAVDVNYRFSLGKLPVFGPGAKIKVTFGGESQLAQVLYFWRRPRRAGTMTIVSAAQALERFRGDPAFYRLRHTDAIVEIHRIQLGYYALPPSNFQRIYPPVYAIDATVRTRALPRYDFRRFVVAVEMSPERAKEMDAIANPTACRVF